jgi:hypothetical protein
VQKLLQEGIIKESNSPWNSPILVVLALTKLYNLPVAQLNYIAGPDYVFSECGWIKPIQIKFFPGYNITTIIHFDGAQ